MSASPTPPDRAEEIVKSLTAHAIKRWMELTESQSKSRAGQFCLAEEKRRSFVPCCGRCRLNM